METLHFSKSLHNKLTVTIQPHKLATKSLCYFKAVTCSYLLCENHEFRFKFVGDMCRFVYGSSRVEVVAQAACTKSMESTASLLSNLNKCIIPWHTPIILVLI